MVFVLRASRYGSLESLFLSCSSFFAYLVFSRQAGMTGFPRRVSNKCPIHPIDICSVGCIINMSQEMAKLILLQFIFKLQPRSVCSLYSWCFLVIRTNQFPQFCVFNKKCQNLTQMKQPWIYDFLFIKAKVNSKFAVMTFGVFWVIYE